MRATEKELARILRKEGMSLKNIYTRVSAPHSTISRWLRDIFLTEEQLDKIPNNQHEKIAVAIKLGRQQRWNLYAEEAKQEWDELSKNIDFMFGLALYIGEGGKTEGPSISNCDPRVLRKAIVFFNIIGAPLKNIKAKINIHDNGNVQEAEKFWSQQLSIPLTNFTKTYVIVSSASKRLKDKNLQPYGTCTIVTRKLDNSTKLFVKIKQWMDLSLE